MDQEFVTAEFDAFLAAYLPFVPKDTDVDACFERMRNGNGTDNEPLIKPILLTGHSPGSGKATIDDGLSFHFADQVDRPRQGTEDSDTDNNVFAKLHPIAEVISESSIEGRSRQYKFFDCQNVIAAPGNKIDACFVPDEFREFDEKERLRTGNIAVACEWRLEKDGIPENNIQMVLANIQMTNCDVCRMFSFGISIEGEELKLWYFSQSHSAVSKAVDYIQNPKFLIKAFISFMFATPDEMGFDPTMKRHLDGSFTYKLSVSPPRYFRSIKCISEVRSNNITGRMTRVWSVKEVDSMSEVAQFVSNHIYVLKDVWLDETARTEKEIQSDIFNDIERFWHSNQDARKGRNKFKDLLTAHEEIVTTGKYKKHFLTIEVDSTEGSTKKAVNGERVYGLFTDMGISSVSGSKNAAALSRTKAHMDQEYSRPIVGVEMQRKNIERDVAPKRQYRVVFKEMCEAVGHLKKLGEVFDVVKQTLIPLQLLFCAGWVHRDISSGNVLAYKPTRNSEWIAILSDLEYAKRFPPGDDVRPHKDPKTGTPIFMATEILLQGYLYTHAPKAVKIQKKKKIRQSYYTVDYKKEEGDRPGALHNYQHDLECLWWFLLWSMTSRVDYKPSQEFAAPIFQNSLTLSQDRKNAFVCWIGGTLDEVLIPAGAATLSRFMEITRSLLHGEYLTREKQRLIRDPRSYVDVYTEFQDAFTGLYGEQDISWREIELISASSSEIKNSTKIISRPIQSEPSTRTTQRLPDHLQQARGTVDVHIQSAAGSSTNNDRSSLLRKSKRREKELQLEPREALEEDRPSKRLRLMDE